MNNRIHIGVCGIGLGHAARCKVIIKKLLDLGCYVSISSYGDALAYFAAAGFPVARCPSVSYGLGSDGSVSIKSTVIKNLSLPFRFLSQALVEAKLMEEFRPDIVLSDTRASTVLMAKSLGIPALLLINQYRVIVRSERWKFLAEIAEAGMGILELIWELSDKILIADYPEPWTVSRANLVLRDSARGRALYIGPLMDRKPREYMDRREAIRERFVLTDEGPVVFIHSTGPLLERERFVRLIMDSLSGLSDFQVIFTRGRLGGKGVVKYGKNVILDWVEDEYELFSIADVVVTRAGQTTLTKALAFGKPLVVVPIPKHTEQESNSEALSNRGAAVILEEREVSPENLREAVNEALDSLDRTTLERYKQLAEQLDGVNKVIEELLNHK